VASSARRVIAKSQVTTPIDEFGEYAALDPFFRIIDEGLAGFVDGGTSSISWPKTSSSSM